MSKLGESLTLPCGAVVPNRILKSAMTEGLADDHDRATEGHVNLYRQWSEGGTGIVVTGNVMIDRRFLERPGNVVIDGNGGETQLAAWAKAGTVAGNHLWMQISHPGRQVQKMTAAQPHAPSEVQVELFGLFGKPKAMDEADIEQALSGYARVAKVAKDAGFTGVQIHAAHGYLISEYLSPIANKRTDQWGGSIENRARFLLEAVRRTREQVGSEYPIAVKLNSSDFQKNGFTLEECKQVASWLSDAGVDLLEISGGSYETPKLMGVESDMDENNQKITESTRKREAYFLEYAREIRSAVKMPLCVTGGFRSREVMEQALADGELDVVGLARPLCTETDISARLISGQADACETHEQHLKIGNGYFGPQSSSRFIKTMNFQALVTWYYWQILKLANNDAPDRGITALRSLLKHFWTEFKIGRARKKVMKAEAK